MMASAASFCSRSIAAASAAPIALFVLGATAEDDVRPTRAEPGRGADLVRKVAPEYARCRHARRRHPEHEVVRPPVRQVEEGIEVAFDHRHRVALEITERVAVREAAGGDLAAG